MVVRHPGDLDLRAGRSQRVAEHAQAEYANRRYASAADDWRKASKLGSAEAAFNLGKLSEEGKGTVRSMPNAVDWYLKAATLGHVGAQLQLAKILLYGAKSRPRWLDLAERVNADVARRNAEVLFPEGTQVPANPQEAIKWLRMAAEANNAEACAILGSLYLRGTGCEKDEGQARQWFEKAAAQNNAAGLFGLGDIYFQGKGVEAEQTHPQQTGSYETQDQAMRFYRSVRITHALTHIKGANQGRHPRSDVDHCAAGEIQAGNHAA